MSVKPDAPQAIAPTDKERQAGEYSARNLQRVLGALHQDGLVILRNVIDRDHIDALNVTMCEDADRLLADPDQAFNHNVKSNILQRPPVTSPYLLYEDVFFNSFLLQIANVYLGPKPIWNWLTANTAAARTPGLRQPVHKDSSFDHPLCPYYFIANVPLCDFTADNGATEFWLGSHAQTSVGDQQTAPRDGSSSSGGGGGGGGVYSNKLYGPGETIPWIAEEPLAQRRAVRPPCQPEARRGDVVIRDLRTWHAGMPNPSGAHRVMLGLGYQSPYHPNYTARLHLPMAMQDFFLGRAKGRVEVRANFYSDEEFAATKADTYFDIRPQYEADELE